MVAVEDLSIRQGAFALKSVSFAVPAGSYAVLMGRTGSGKTTLLESIAGVRRPSAGKVLLRGRDATHDAPAFRNLGYVPQDAAPFRTMTVRENLGFALAVRKVARAAIDVRVDELSESLGLERILDRRAIGLSGGEAQRVALGRALAFRPDVLLLDEPLNAVDEETRDDLLTVLDMLRRSRTVTVVHVTHTKAEGERLADVLLEFHGGQIRETAR